MFMKFIAMRNMLQNLLYANLMTRPYGQAFFNSDNWLAYFKQRLLPACERVYPGAKHVFVMDNAGHHVSFSFQVEDISPGSPPIEVDKACSSKSILCK
jgi:hypothetical protein